MTMITPSYLGETIEYSSLHACRSTLEDPTPLVSNGANGPPTRSLTWVAANTTHIAVSIESAEYRRVSI